MSSLSSVQAQNPILIIIDKKTKFYISYDNSLYLISNTTDIMFYPTFPPPNVSDPARLLPFIFSKFEFNTLYVNAIFICV